MFLIVEYFVDTNMLDSLQDLTVGYLFLLSGQPQLSNSYAAIYVGKNPLSDMVFLPFSQSILESYKILLPALQFLTKDIVLNKMKSIMRKTNGIIPTVVYGVPRKYNEIEKSKYTEALVDFYQKTR